MARAGILASGEEPTASDAAYALEEMNTLLKLWQTSGPDLWRTSEGSLTLTAATAAFALNEDVFRVVSCRIRRNGIDTPMEPLVREEYFDMPLKTATGVPTQYYYDVERYGGTLYIWPVLATASGETISYTYQRRFYDVASLGQTLDVPQEYISVVAWALAAAISPAFGKDDTKFAATAARMLAEMQAADREPVIRFVPDRRR